METLDLILNAAVYDQTVHNPETVPQLEDLRLIIKPDVTLRGKAGVCIAFTVQLPDGKLLPVQAVTTWALLRRAVELGQIQLDQLG